MEEKELEAVIAAILTSGATPGAAVNAAQVVNDYRRVLKRLRETGGVFDTSAPTGTTKP